MKIRYTTSGGIAYFPGLQKPVEIDVDALDAGSRDELRRLAQAAAFFDLPTAVGAPAKGSADCQVDIVSIEDQGRRHEVRVAPPVDPGALHDLLQAVRRHVQAVRSASVPAAGTKKTPKDGGGG